VRIVIGLNKLHYATGAASREEGVRGFGVSAQGAPHGAWRRGLGGKGTGRASASVVSRVEPHRRDVGRRETQTGLDVGGQPEWLLLHPFVVGRLGGFKKNEG